MKRLTTIQGVLTVLGLLTGIAAISLPLGFGPPKGNAEGVLPSLAELVKGRRDLLGFLNPIFLLLLAVPISASYLAWLLTGRLAPWAWRAGYVLAVLAGAVLLVWLGWLTFEIFSEEETVEVQDVIEYGVFVLSGLAPLALGAWWVMRNRRVGVPQALNALIALQAVYVANALMLLVFFMPYDWLSGGWHIGALFAFLTMVIYVVQIVLSSLRKGGTEILAGTPQP